MVDVTHQVKPFAVFDIAARKLLCPASAPSRKYTHTLPPAPASAPPRLRGRPASSSTIGKDRKSRRLSKADRSEAQRDIVDMTHLVAPRTNWARGSNEKRMRLALDHYSKTKNIKSTCRLFNIPKSVFMRRVDRGHTNIHAGRLRALPPAVEQQVADHVWKMAEIGHGLGTWAFDIQARELYGIVVESEDVRALVNNIVGPRYNGRAFSASRGWFHRFQQRFPDVSRRRTQALDRLRASGANEKSIASYFNLLERSFELLRGRSGMSPR